MPNIQPDIMTVKPLVSNDHVMLAQVSNQLGRVGLRIPVRQ